MDGEYGSGPGGAMIGGRYVLDEVVGRGGMADVYRARDRRLDRTVAVKVFRPGGDPEGARRLVAEARLLAPLHHPGVVAVSDGGVDESQPFLVMPLVTGGTLAGRLAAGPLPVVEVARLGRDLAGTLAYLHGHGIVHRDVKPSNILLDDDGRPLLGDFGVSRLVDASRVTTTGQIVGTAAYLAPEQVRGGETGSAADVYALGLVLLECLTGRTVYVGTNQIGVATARLHRDAEVPDDLPDRLRDLLTAMVATEPERRPDAPACAERLAAVVSELVDPDATVVLPVQPGPGGPGPTRRPEPFGEPAAPVGRTLRRPVLAMSGLALLVVAAAVVATLLPFTFGASEPPPEHIVGTGAGTPSSTKPHHSTAPTPAVSPSSRRPAATSAADASTAAASARRTHGHGGSSGREPHRRHLPGKGHDKPHGGHGHGHGGGHGP
ncbi:MAG TPA: serine/threonine-protein kinase [Streptosporangiales bacterium]